MRDTVFFPATPDERNEMLETLGLSDVDELFSGIPSDLQAAAFELPNGVSEMEMLQQLEALSGRNAAELTNFCGGGFYDHFIPAAVDQLAGRGEFFTAYTPYQPEASQGTLQAVFEWQTAMARLTGMEAANASLYDGGTALFEATMMALRCTRRNRIIVDEGVNPIYRTMLRCYTRNLSIEYQEIPVGNGGVDTAAVKEAVDQQTAAVLLQYPNFFGVAEDLADLIGTVHESGALAVVSAYPTALGLLKPPGEMGADIVTGEAQCLGMPLSFGGPYLGYFCTRKKWARKMPGRIVGQTRDDQGRTGYVLTLQAREQHIRREKATSNICTNQGLCALRSIIYLSLLGRAGFRDNARQCAARAAYAMERLRRIPGVKPAFPEKPFFNEFAIDLPRDAAETVSSMIDRGIAAGFPVGRYYKDRPNTLLLAFTEKRTREEIDILAAKLESAVKS